MNLDILIQDVKYTLRTLRNDPSFTFVAVLILALAIGANIAVFSVVNTLMLRPSSVSPTHMIWFGSRHPPDQVRNVVRYVFD